MWQRHTGSQSPPLGKTLALGGGRGSGWLLTPPWHSGVPHQLLPREPRSWQPSDARWVPALTCCARSCCPLCSRLSSSCSASLALSSSASPRLACSSSRSWSRLSSCRSRALCLACRDCTGQASLRGAAAAPARHRPYTGQQHPHAQPTPTACCGAAEQLRSRGEQAWPYLLVPQHALHFGLLLLQLGGGGAQLLAQALPLAGEQLHLLLQLQHLAPGHHCGPHLLQQGRLGGLWGDKSTFGPGWAGGGEARG